MVKNIIEQRVRYSETDRMRFVYYSRYFEYFEVGRINLLREIGLPYDIMEDKLGVCLPVVETHAKFHFPGRLDDVLLIKTTLQHPPSSTLRFDYEIYHKSQLLTIGYTSHAFYYLKNGKSGKPPKELILVIQKAWLV